MKNCRKIKRERAESEATLILYSRYPLMAICSDTNCCVDKGRILYSLWALARATLSTKVQGPSYTTTTKVRASSQNDKSAQA